jgi:hypothetical protein
METATLRISGLPPSPGPPLTDTGQSFGKPLFSRGNNDGTMNEIQYVYDAGGHKKRVIIPVELWERTL